MVGEQLAHFLQRGSELDRRQQPDLRCGTVTAVECTKVVAADKRAAVVDLEQFKSQHTMWH